MVFGYFMRFLTAPLLILRLYFGQREIAGIQKPADVIKAENNIRGFGISFSKNNLDVDGNGLTDIAIGSYLSEILGLGQRGRCCFCAGCHDRKMYLDNINADEGPFSLLPLKIVVGIIRGRKSLEVLDTFF